MESKIEQIDLGSTEWELSDALRKYKPEVMAKVLDKMVEIIDHLNSQDQEEEKIEYFDKGDKVRTYKSLEVSEKAYSEEPTVEDVYIEDTPEEITAEQLCEDNRKRMERLINKEMEERGFIRKIKDTPEETESEVQEWEKKWEEFFLYVTNDKNWVDGRPEWKGNVYITLYNAMKDFIKNLLLERERWAIDTFLKDTASYNSFHNGRPRTMRNGLSGEGFEVRVSKLTTK